MSDQTTESNEINSTKDHSESKHNNDVLIDVIHTLKDTVDSNDSFMREVIDKNEKKERRQEMWTYIRFALIIFISALSITAMMLIRGGVIGGTSKFTQAHTAIVNVRGQIADQEPASADRIITNLRHAFESKDAKAIILRINSPGGSPVQSGYINDEIHRLRSLYPEKKVYAVISDLGASGAYYIAVAADEIYADKASLIGSIGVTASGFGFVDAIQKVGVERRNFTSGAHKGFLDPFSPVDQKEKDFWSDVLSKTHQQFIDVVKKGRGERLNGNSQEDLFSGLIWNGEQALELGLIDGLGNSSYVAREIVGQELLIEYTVQEDPFSKLIKLLGASFGTSVVHSLSMDTHTQVPVLR